ncbi:FAD-dependent oxidoreductase [Thioclava sp. F28-4]|uniref:FAD-dependent oxidoreductase n=1 Tax=Thioclava sp. F28-4 TaxID=1915315 RepID=UPI00099774AC|nr:FAD-dependent oxidoreductase [Thioclava sp. F28-4]OOY06253.1 hypothetical protein BMI87_01745 [Thioclava sp. F28-4]
MGQPRHIVIGAGIVGTMTAWALARRGLDVTVIDRLPGPAELCSRANAGIVSIGHASAWAGPDALPQLLRAMAGRNPGVKLTAPFDPALWRWGTTFLRNCTGAAQARNTARMMRLAETARAALPEMAQELGLDALIRFEGGLYLYNATAEIDAHDDGRLTRIDPDWLAENDPLLAETGFAGAFLSPMDAAGNCHEVTRAAAKALTVKHGVQFRYNSAVTGFTQADGKITGVNLADETLPAAQVILATGVETPDLARPLGFAPDIYPVKGYSGTWEVRDQSRLPRHPYIDEAAMLAVASYGGVLRVTAIAEFAGRDRTLREDRTKVLTDYVAARFGDAVSDAPPVLWTGLRPSTPHGPPFLGRVKSYDNLWVNAGHGQLGWTLSAGCGALLADAITGAANGPREVSAPARWLAPL